jgi:hypothetical protein
MIAIYWEGLMASTSPTTDNGRTIAGMYEAFGRGSLRPRVLFPDGKVCRNDNFHDTALWVAALS